MRVFLVLLILFASIFQSIAQTPADHWTFGDKTGIKFSQNSVQPFNTNVSNTAEGSATISNYQGQLAAYSGTDSNTTLDCKIFNTNNQVMLNGNDPRCNGTITQLGQFLWHPNPDSANLLYYFMLGSKVEQDSFVFSYSVIDMNQDGGLGAVIQGRKNKKLASSICEKITVVPKCDGDGFWIVVYRINENKYLSYSFTSAGLNSTPIVSLGIFNTIENKRGYMKSSPSSKRIAMVGFAKDTLEIGKYDNLNGTVSDVMKIGIPPLNGGNFAGAYGLEFSPNSEYLYISGYSNTFLKSFIYQYKLVPFEVNAIQNSMDTIVKSTTYVGAPQLAPDMKIYALGNDSMHIIENPNSEGAACKFQLNQIPLAPGIGIQGLPGFPINYLYDPIQKDTICLADTLRLFFDDSCHVSLLWNFDDPASGNNTSTQNLGEHVFSDTGTYDVSLAVVYSADTHYYSNEIVVRSSVPTNPLPDSLINCNNQAIALDFSNPQFTFEWSTGSDSSGILLIDDQTLSVTISGFCGSVSDSAVVIIDTLPTLELSTDSILCEGDSTSVNALLNTNSVFTNWSNGDTFGFEKSINYIAGADTIIWLNATNACGEASDTVRIVSVPQPDLSWFSDSILCEQNDLFIFEPNIEAQDHFMTLDSNALVSDSLSKPWQIEIPGNYYMTAINVCDTITKSAFLSPFQRIEVELGADTTICEGDSLHLNATWPNSNYAWSTGQSDSSISVNNDGNYVVTITNTPCQLVEQRQVFFANPPCDSVNCKFSFSNVFTPNADGVNDQLTIANNCKDLPYSVSIYNRWGQLVFRDEAFTTDQRSSIKPTINWDGFVNGEPASAGVYFAVIEYNEGAQRSIRASITLLR